MGDKTLCRIFWGIYIYIYVGYLWIFMNNVKQLGGDERIEEPEGHAGENGTTG